jgi:hypothetical protein
MDPRTNYECWIGGLVGGRYQIQCIATKLWAGAEQPPIQQQHNIPGQFDIAP